MTATPIDPGGLDTAQFVPPVCREVSACRACGGDLRDVFTLGDICLNGFPRPGEPDPPKVPLTLCLCRRCSLLQLRHTTDPDRLFREFFYRSGITETMRNALWDASLSSADRVHRVKGDVVLDIGCNDGTFLRFFSGQDYRRVGFEPARNLTDEAAKGGIEVVPDYFSAAAYANLPGIKPAKVVTALAMFYDLDDPGAFLDGVYSIMDKGGLFVCQVSYLPLMLEKCDFPSICHEHLLYFSFSSLWRLFRDHGLNVWDVEENDVNGGSIRVYATIDIREPTQAAKSLLYRERGLLLGREATYNEFAERVAANRRNVRDALQRVLPAGLVYLLGASTKIQVALQYWGLDRTWLSGASERDEHKWGRETVGTRIPIVSETEARRHAKTFLVGPWPFRDELIQREAVWLKKGGRMLFPLPEVSIVGKEHIPSKNPSP